MKFTISIHESIDSTMDIARGAAMNGSVEGLVIQASEQTGGRGRRGNMWSSPKGNLYQSILLRPSVPRGHWGQLSFVIAVALGVAIAKYASYHLKWPNDVLINDQKLAGILIEAADDYVIVGTGVNIEICPEDRAKIHDFWDVSVNDFRDIFLDRIAYYYDLWQADGFTPIRDLWLDQAYKIGETIQARTPKAVYEGVFEDLDEQGILLLREKDGLLRQINSGEIVV